MKISIYTMTHKEFPVPPDPAYIPLRVGSANGPDFGYLRDDTGDNISAKNCYYSELTGLYWVWKHDFSSDIIGSCHYRRYLVNEQEKVLSPKEMEEALKVYDLLTTRKVHLNNSYREGFSANHNLKALDVTGEVIKDLYPSCHEAFVSLVNGPETYFGNMLITRRDLYAEYCSWLFSIFAEVERRIDLDTDEDAYHKRVLGFISEFLLLVWCSVKELRVKEYKVGMLGEKAEVREMKETLAAYFKAKDPAGAHAYFLDCLKVRPDVLMEASDITGELHLAMQVIATVEKEQSEGLPCLFDATTDFKELMTAMHAVNAYVLAGEKGPRPEGISDAALDVARQCLC